MKFLIIFEGVKTSQEFDSDHEAWDLQPAHTVKKTREATAKFKEIRKYMVSQQILKNDRRST